MLDVVAKNVHRQVAHTLAIRLGQVGERVRKIFRQGQGYPGHDSLDGERLLGILHRQVFT
jgi:hypothetical protein